MQKPTCRIHLWYANKYRSKKIKTKKKFFPVISSSEMNFCWRTTNFGFSIFALFLLANHIVYGIDLLFSFSIETNRVFRRMRATCVFSFQWINERQTRQIFSTFTHEYTNTMLVLHFWNVVRTQFMCRYTEEHIRNIEWSRTNATGVEHSYIRCVYVCMHIGLHAQLIHSKNYPNNTHEKGGRAQMQLYTICVFWTWHT